MKKSLIFLLVLGLFAFLSGPAAAVSDSPSYFGPFEEVSDVMVEAEYAKRTVTLQYDDGIDDSPGHGWRLNASYSYRVKFNPTPGWWITINKVKFYIGDVLTAGDVVAKVQSGIDETYGSGSVYVSAPGWYDVPVLPKLKADSFFYVVLESAGFDGGGGDDIHPPRAGRSAQGLPGSWSDKDANFMVRAVGTEKTLREKKVAVLICGDTPYTAFEAVSQGFGTYNGGYQGLMKFSNQELSYLQSYGFDEFWSDVVWMYHILIEQGGFHPDNIYVLFGDGVDWNVSHPSDVPDKYIPQYGTMTDFAATMDNVRLVFEGLANGDIYNNITKVTSNDSLFVWTFDHGITTGGGGPQSGDSLICLMDGDMTDTEFASLLHAAPYKQAAVFMQQCFSGGFIDNVANSNTFIATAARGDESAYRADNFNPFPDAVENETWGSITCHHGEWNYYFMSAFEGRSPLNTPVDANTRKPKGKISSIEAFLWAKGHESGPETNQMRDDGSVRNKWIRTWKTIAE